MVNNLFWIIVGIILLGIILVIIILFTRKNKKQVEVPLKEYPKAQEKPYKEDPNYPSKKDQEHALNETYTFKTKVKPIKMDKEDYYYPEDY